MKKDKQVKNSRLRFPSKRFIMPVIIFAIFLSGAILILHQVIVSRPKPVFETPGSEMKKIPHDVKKELSKTASPDTSATFYVPILMYHYVEYVQDKKDTIRQSLDVNPNIFEQQIQTLEGNGYTFLTAKELGDILDGKAQVPQKPVLLTFDDGHRDFYTNVLPILEKYRVKATAYIIPGFLGGSDFMTKQQLQEVVSSGLVDVGAHTVHHISLKGRLLPVVQYEVTRSKAMLEQNYHINVVSFAYPNGTFDQQTINVVKNAGYTTAVSTIPGVQQSLKNRFFLFRLRPGSRTQKSLLALLQNRTFKAY